MGVPVAVRQVVLRDAASYLTKCYKNIMKEGRCRVLKEGWAQLGGIVHRQNRGAG